MSTWPSSGAVSPVASAAYEIAQSATTLVLEAEPTCDHHTTGRSAAIFTECYGDAVVRRLAIASRAFLGSPPVGFSDGEVLTPRSILFAAMTGQELALEAAYADFSALVPGLAMLDVAGAVERCPVLRPARLCGAVLEPLASDIRRSRATPGLPPRGAPQGRRRSNIGAS